MWVRYTENTTGSCGASGAKRPARGIGKELGGSGELRGARSNPLYPIEEDEIIVFEDYLREGYGILDKEVAESIRIVAETEGVLLDPVYTGKAMSGMIDLIRKGYFRDNANIVFLHSGGTPALFPYREGIIENLSRDP